MFLVYLEEFKIIISGALLFSTTFDNFDNTDPFYIKKTIVGGNVSELRMYIGDDG